MRDGEIESDRKKELRCRKGEGEEWRKGEVEKVERWRKEKGRWRKQKRGGEKKRDGERQRGKMEETRDEKERQRKEEIGRKGERN